MVNLRLSRLVLLLCFLGVSSLNAHSARTLKVKSLTPQRVLELDPGKGFGPLSPQEINALPWVEDWLFELSEINWKLTHAYEEDTEATKQRQQDLLDLWTQAQFVYPVVSACIRAAWVSSNTQKLAHEVYFEFNQMRKLSTVVFTYRGEKVDALQCRGAAALKVKKSDPGLERELPDWVVPYEWN